MKKTGIILSSILMLSLIPFSFAEPESYESFIKWYQPILDSAKQEKLAPRKQFDSGVFMADTICFEGKRQILKISDPTLVACVTPQTQKILVERDWGIPRHDFGSEPGHGAECSNSWKIIFDGSRPNDHSIIKIIKVVVKPYAKNLLWQPMTITSSNSDYLYFTWKGNFVPEEVENITETLKMTYISITDVHYIPGACV